jgi:PadR family transcriptional regulator
VDPFGDGDGSGMSRTNLNGQLDLLLLASLTHGEAHGYAVITRIQDRSEGRFELLEGTVYPALHRMERDGFVSSRWASEGGRRRRTYALTARGRQALGARTSEWSDFVSGVRAVLTPMTTPAVTA